MKPAMGAILAVLGLCGLHAIAPLAVHAQWSSGHYDTVPHTTTHYHVVPHNGHYDFVPHTTTHYDQVWHDTSGWNWGSGNGGSIQGGNVVQGQSVVTNRIPTTVSANTIPSRMGGMITLVNPTDNGGPVKYVLNSFSYTANPGDSQTLTNDRSWTITFDNGRGRQVNHRLERGAYEFRVDNANGWTLARVDEGDAPAAPPRPAAAR